MRDKNAILIKPSGLITTVPIYAMESIPYHLKTSARLAVTHGLPDQLSLWKIADPARLQKNELARALGESLWTHKTWAAGSVRGSVIVAVGNLRTARGMDDMEMALVLMRLAVLLRDSAEARGLTMPV